MLSQATETALPAPIDRSSQPETVEELFLVALRRKEPEAWTRLFQDHYNLVFRAALAQVREPSLAEDITAQVFLEAVEGIGRYRPRGKPLAAWLLTIARHRSIDALRRLRREQSQPPEANPPSEFSAGHSSLEALTELTPKQREVVHLRFVEDRSVDEVASLTGYSPAAVKSLQHRALRTLRLRIEQNTRRRE